MEVIKVENLYKQYRLGQVSTGSIAHDLNRWWHIVRGKEDPYEKITGLNNRDEADSNEYVWAIQDINFSVKQGEVLGIIGKNGAGKSTLLKILSKVTSPTKGNIKVKGRIASLLEVGTGFHPELTGRENIFLNGAILGMTKSEIRSKFDEIVAFSGVEKYIDTPVKRYSSGMYVRLAFAVAAHLEPEILIVDEVLAVGDAEFQKKCLGKMKDVSGEGRTVLFVSHNMEAIQNLCHNSVLLKNGKIEYHGLTSKAINLYSDGDKLKLSSQYNNIYSGNSEIFFKKIFIHQKDSVDGNFCSSEPIIFNICIESLVRIKQFRIGLRILNEYETPVGLLFSNEIISIDNKSIVDLDLIISNHNLSKGIYFVDLSIGTGNEESHPIDILILEKAVSFQITKNNNYTNSLVTTWNIKNWGNINFKDFKLNINEYF
jgi:lipopolysaccharide transport system ATP-binding protein